MRPPATRRVPPATQRGLAAATVVIVIILAMVLLMLGRAALETGASLDQREANAAVLERARQAIHAFAALNRRLPCPADGASASGLEARAGSACTFPDGTLPWQSLAIAREHAVDGWGRKLSYRVFAGASGFTRDNGIDATNCNRDAPVTGTAVTDCNSVPFHTNHRDDFLLGKGLSVNDRGTNPPGVAVVIVSHGQSGLGAFGAESGSRTVLPAAGGGELANTQGAGTFQILDRNTSVPSSDAAHFDDEVIYLQATELVSKAGLDQRAWPLPPPPPPPPSSFSATYNLAAIQAENPSYTGASQFTGLSSLSTGGIAVTATSGGAAREIGFRTDLGLGGIGVIGGSSSNAVVSSSLNEVLTFQFGSGANLNRVDIAFSQFNNLIADSERVEVSFWRDGVQLQAITRDAWRLLTGPSNCLFTPSAGNEFDRIDVRPLPRTLGASSFTVSAIHACSAAFTSPCTTSVPGSQACP